MNFLFSFLGAIADFNRQLAQRRVGAFGLNILLMISLGLLAIVSTYVHRTQSSTLVLPAKMDVKKANDIAKPGQFVLMDGIVYPRPRLELPAADGKEWVLMVEEAGSRVIVAERTKNPERSLTGWQVVRGMTAPIPSALQAELAKNNYELEGLAVNRSLILVADAQPNTAKPWLLFFQQMAFGSILILIPFALTFGMGYRVFRATNHRGVGQVAPAHVDLGSLTLAATGKLAMNETHSIVVDGANLQARQIPSGDIALVHEDTNGTIFGVLFNPSSAQVVDMGTLYKLSGEQNAAIIRFHNSISNRREELMLTFGSEGDRALFLSTISREAQTARAA